MEIKDLAGISEPLKRLVEVIASGLGNVSKSYLIKKTADAKAYELRVISQALQDGRQNYPTSEYNDGTIKFIASSEKMQTIDIAEQPAVTALEVRSIDRQNYKAITEQQRIESITAQAAEELAADAAAPDAKPETEWTSRFFNIASEISSEQLQYLWGKILAGEIRRPGSFSLRTLEILRNISTDEAEIFALLCQFIVKNGESHFFITDPKYVYSKTKKINYSKIVELADAGLISSDMQVHMNFPESKPGETRVLMNGKKLIKFDYSGVCLPVSFPVRLLTRAGADLLSLIPIEPDLEYLKLVTQKFVHPSLVMTLADFEWAEQGKVTYTNQTPWNPY